MPEPKVLTLQAFKSLIAIGERLPADVILRKSYVPEIKAVDDDPRGLQFSISSEAVDRDSDTLNVQGWKLSNYRKNPVVLWAHDYRQLPVGKAVKIFTEDQKLKAIDTFPSRDVHPFADTVFQLVKGGYLNATSVGFLPLKYERVDPESDEGRERRGGVDFKSQELLEHSIVPVPSNPEALVEARSALPKADWKAYLGELERILDEAHEEDGGVLIVPRANLEQAWKLLSPRRSTLGKGKDGYPPAVPPQQPPAMPSGGGDDEAGGGTQDDQGDIAVDVALYNALVAHFNGIRSANQTLAAGLRNLTGSRAASGRRKDDKPPQGVVSTPPRDTALIEALAQHAESMAELHGNCVESLNGMPGGPFAGAGGPYPPAVPAQPGAPQPTSSSVQELLGKADVPPGLKLLLEQILESQESLRYALRIGEKGVIGYKKLPLAPESTPWDAGKEIAAASVDDLKVMATWYSGDGTKKGDFKLPHHHASGNHATVWRGVANAAARLAQTSLPAGDIPGVKKHLASHYRDFGKDAPWKAAPEAWATFELSVRSLKSQGDELDDERLASMLEAYGFEAEAKAVRETRDEAVAAIEDLLDPWIPRSEEIDLGNGESITAGALMELAKGELGDTIRALADQAARQAISAATGRLPD